MAKRKKPWALNIGTWPVNVLFTDDRKILDATWARYRPDEALESFNDRGAHMFPFNDPPGDEFTTYLIYVSRSMMDYSVPEIAAIVAHEAVHVFQYLMRRVGEQSWGDETEAYFVQAITRECLQIMRDGGWTSLG